MFYARHPINTIGCAQNVPKLIGGSIKVVIDYYRHSCSLELTVLGDDASISQLQSFVFQKMPAYLAGATSM